MPGYDQQMPGLTKGLDDLRKMFLEAPRVKRIFMTTGLPASGKTTWAKAYVESNLTTVRVNKDEIREMLYNGVYSAHREKLVLEVRDAVIKEALEANCDVIVDDTNLNPKHRMKLAEIAHEHNAVVEIKDFTDVPLEVCLERNAGRANPIPEDAIRRMYEQYLAEKKLDEEESQENHA